eukprot:scaffold85789_cov63-Phaeocystis_antarctica.AAC.2
MVPAGRPMASEMPRPRKRPRTPLVSTMVRTSRENEGRAVTSIPLAAATAGSPYIISRCDTTSTGT